jgi:hypothetical protein
MRNEEDILFDDQVTPDENLLLRFQEAKVRYDNSGVYGIEDPELEHEYCQAVLALDNLNDPILRDLARDIQGPSTRRAIEAEEELFALSLRVKNLFPLASHRIH